MFCCQSNNIFECKIILLDNREIQFEYKGGIKGQKILDDVSEFLSLNEVDYFGFRFIDLDSQVQWLDLNKSIKSQFKTNLNQQITLYFNVKFYLPDPCKLRYELTRYLFYKQLRADILQGRLPLQFDYAIELFGYVLQDELGDYDPKRDTVGYASELQFMPNQSEELENFANAKHVKLKGISPNVIEINFLKKVKWLDMYGVDLQPVLDENNMEYFVGLTPTGISVYRNKTKISSYFWPRIYKIDYKDTKFYLTVIDKSNDRKTHVFHLNKESACKHLWKCCVDQHTFFRLKTMNGDISESPKLASKSRSIKSLNQISLTQQNESFQRAPPKRILRRISIHTEEALVIDKKDNDSFIMPRNTTNDESPFGSQKSLSKADWKDLEKQGGLFSSNSGRNSPGSTRSISSYRCPNPRPESASETDLNISQKSRRRRNQSDSENENTSRRSNSRRRKHRSGSRSSAHKMVSSEAQWNAIIGLQQNEAKIVKSKSTVTNLNNPNDQNDPSRQATNAKIAETCHETSLEEDDFNDAEKKRQRRRRKRSKSPSAAVKPPGELRQHINYNLIEPSGLSHDQLREIPFVKIETTAPPFRISPHQKHRKYSPHRRKSQPDLHESKSSISYLKNGNAQIVKTTKPSDSEELDVQDIKFIEPSSSNPQNNTELLIKMKSLDDDSGCDELTTAIINSRQI